MVAAGMVPNSLMTIVQSAVGEHKKLEAEDLVTKDGGLDNQMVLDMVEFTDQLTMRCLAEPKAHPVPENEDDRDDDLLYVDEIDEEDKMFIFQWATGGTTDVERFRQEYSTKLDALGSITEAGSTTK